MTPPRIAVAGGRGFIGRHVCAALADAGVVAFGREGPPTRTCEVLIWAAGGRAGTPDELLAQHVAAPLAALALRPRRVVYLGTGEVYGRQDPPFREDLPVAPETPYAAAKAAGERALADACAAAGAALVVVRPAVVYGQGQTGDMLLPAALASLRAGRPFAASEGRQTRDFVHVSDVARLVRRAAADDAPPGVYNAGSGEELAVRDALHALAAGFEPERGALLRLGAVPTRPGEAMRYVLDITRAAAALGWRPRVRPADGLRALARG